MYWKKRTHSTGMLSGKLRSILSCILLASVILGCDSNGNSSDSPAFDEALIRTFENVLQGSMDDYEIPGAVVGIWVPGKGEVVFAQGVSDLDTDKRLTPDDHMRIGSVTKSFTVTVILQLVEEGLLSLDDPLSRFFPDIENSDATIAELANMRSGIFNYTEDGDFVAELIEDLLREWTPQELVDVGDRNAPYFPAGDGWHYSNTSTVILGMVIEQLTGNSAGIEIQQRIIEPLELGGTVYPTSPELPSPFSRGYLYTGPEDGLLDVTLSAPSSSAASGAMISRLSDLRRWAEALGKGSLLNADTQQERLASLAPMVFDPCADTDPERPVRACPEYDKYGVGIGELEGWVGHTGEGLGYTALVMFEPESAAVIAIQMNSSAVGAHVPTEIFREYAKILKAL
ncbi:D-alanyl-D-alanine carboxypeptidase [Halioglobus japonicus]|nr:D-alanyl-D-alanine carboxypeptidase [Halioglobus japonicus]